MSGALSLGVIGGANGPTAVFVTGSPAPLVIYLLAINVLAFAVYGWDKARSKVQGARRVPEKTLFLLAILGGSVGAILGMRVWHHKTRHWYFKYGLPAILLAQLALAWYLGGLLVTNPIPEEYSMDKAVIDKAIAEAVEDAKKDGIHGKATTPYLLAKIKDLTGGDSLESNIQLVLNNARVAAKTAVALCK